jgi:hypothetical protein
VRIYPWLFLSFWGLDTKNIQEKPFLCHVQLAQVLMNTNIFPVATTIPMEPITTLRQVVITSIDVPVVWYAPHFMYVAHDPWGHPAYRVLCRGDCQSIADMITAPQTGTIAR